MICLKKVEQENKYSFGDNFKTKFDGVAGMSGEGESPRMREANNLIVGEANMAEAIFSPGKPFFVPRQPILCGGEERDPTMLSPPSLRAYADRMQADYLRYRHAQSVRQKHSQTTKTLKVFSILKDLLVILNCVLGQNLALSALNTQFIVHFLKAGVSI